MSVYCIVNQTMRLSDTTKKLRLAEPLAYSNSMAHSFRVTVLEEGGEGPADLTGVGCTAKFYRQKTNTTVYPILGTVNTGTGVAEVVLPPSCYAVAGRFVFTMDLTMTLDPDGYETFSTTKNYVSGNMVKRSNVVYMFTVDHPAGAWIGTDAVVATESRTALWIEGAVERVMDGDVIDPGTPVGSIDEVITRANSAANDASVAAGEAREAAETAEGIVNTAVQYTAQTKDASAQAVARGNIGAADAETVDAEIESRQRGLVTYGAPSFTDVTMTRQGVRVVWNYTFDPNSKATKYVPTGAGVVNLDLPSSHPGLVLEDGHIYRLRADYISGSATNDVSVIWSTSGAYSRIAPSYSVANGDYADWYTDLTYSTDEYPNGVWPVLVVIRGTAGNTLVNYTVDFYIEDITEDVEQSVRHGGDIGLNGLVDYGRGPLRANTGVTDGINFSAVGDGMDLVLDTHGDVMLGGTVAAYCRLNGGFKYYNTGALLAKSGDAKVRLTNGHKYRLLTRYVSGDWLCGSGQEVTPAYARAFSVTGTGDDAALSSFGTADWAQNGRDIVSEFEYNEGTDYPDGIYIALFIRRTNAYRCTFDGYHIHITLVDLTEPGTYEVRYDAEQTLTDEQKSQARKNIGAENASAVRVIPNVVGYIAATSTAETVEVDENGVPVNAGSSATTVRYIVLPCSQGDRITVRSPSRISSNTRNWVMLGAVDTSTTPNTRPILAKCEYVTTPTVYTAPAGTELVVFASTKTRIASDTDRYWMGGMTEARLDALEVQQETVSGSAVTITAETNHRYLCGTLDSLSFTPSAEGLCEVIFTAGSDMVNPVLPSSVRMPDWWSGVEANRTYDIMVLDGTLGAVMSWT